jgi:hypothetical protein
LDITSSQFQSYQRLIISAAASWSIMGTFHLQGLFAIGEALHRDYGANRLANIFA